MHSGPLVNELESLILLMGILLMLALVLIIAYPVIDCFLLLLLYCVAERIVSFANENLIKCENSEKNKGMFIDMPKMYLRIGKRNSHIIRAY